MTAEQVARGLEAARARTHGLTEIDEAELTGQHSPLMSPLVWDLAHIGQQEDLWLLRGGDAACQGLLSAKVEKLYEDLKQRHFFDMQPVAGPQKECRVPGATTVHADGKKRSAEHSSNACSDAAQKQSVGDWKSRVLAVAGEEPAQCKMPK